ncbi:MAG: hypothetical protein PHU95_04115 [Candidatus Thermoplasmatota archaeon]|nr:hypothetical protein [Candidatus Thermoplasmatota archaeon]MDD5778612.1 hypothetical protein [Candidatus Thermoplasmatota archaeon]
MRGTKMWAGAAAALLLMLCMAPVYGDFGGGWWGQPGEEIDRAGCAVTETVEVYELSETGQVERSLHLLSPARLQELYGVLSAAGDPHRLLSVLKEYGLVPEAVSLPGPRFPHEHGLLAGLFPLPGRNASFSFNMLCRVTGLGMAATLPFVFPGALLLGSLFALPLFGGGLVVSMVWLCASAVTFLTGFSALVGKFPVLFSSLLSFVMPYTMFTAPVGLMFLNLGVVRTSGVLGNWTAVCPLATLFLGFSGFWVNTVFFSVVLGTSLACVSLEGDWP